MTNGLRWQLDECRVGQVREWQSKDGTNHSVIKLEYFGGSIEPEIDPKTYREVSKLEGQMGAASGVLKVDENRFGVRVDMVCDSISCE